MAFEQVYNVAQDSSQHGGSPTPPAGYSGGIDTAGFFAYGEVANNTNGLIGQVITQVTVANVVAHTTSAGGLVGIIIVNAAGTTVYTFTPTFSFNSTTPSGAFTLTDTNNTYALQAGDGVFVTWNGGSSDPLFVSVSGTASEGDGGSAYNGTSIVNDSGTWDLAAILYITAPTLSVTGNTPANGATNVLDTTTMTITFDNNIDGTTVNSTNITVSPSISGTWSTASNVVTITPSSNLTGNTTYTVTVTTSVKDVFGQTLASNFVYSFTTVVGLAVTSTTPTNGATNIPQNQIATITTNNNLQSGTVNTTNVTISPAVGGYSVTLSPNNQINVNPNGNNLVLSTLYTITVSTSVLDTFGQSLASAFSFHFTIANPPFITGGTTAFVTPTARVIPNQARGGSH